MSTEKHFTVRVVLVDLLPFEKYIPGITYDSRKTNLAEKYINIDGDSFHLTTSSARDFISLCHLFVSGFEDIILEENSIEALFQLVVYTAIDEKFERGKRPRHIKGCYEFILLRSSTAHTLWCKDSTNGKDDQIIYPGDVIEIRGVKELHETCAVCLSNERNIVLQPCGMYCMCLDCYFKWEDECKRNKQPFECPVCKVQIKGYFTIQKAVTEKVDVKVSTKMSIQSLLVELKA
jgi:hypothetical protein